MHWRWDKGQREGIFNIQEKWGKEKQLDEIEREKLNSQDSDEVK